jgi:hypothetical protein
VQRNDGVMPIPNKICVLLKTFVVVCVCGLLCNGLYFDCFNHEMNGM